MSPIDWLAIEPRRWPEERVRAFLTHVELELKRRESVAWTAETKRHYARAVDLMVRHNEAILHPWDD